MSEESRTDVSAGIQMAVARRYSAIGQHPEEESSIPSGCAWALALGYPPALLDGLPLPALEAFTGIGTPVLNAGLRAGERVLDLGCGGGLDTILAGRMVGPAGRVYGVDLAAGMVARARESVTAERLANIEIHEAAVHDLPLADGAVDAVIANGLFNLVPNKAAVAAEVTRVTRPGGRLIGAEIVITDGRSPGVPDLESWFR